MHAAMRLFIFKPFGRGCKFIDEHDLSNDHFPMSALSAHHVLLESHVLRIFVVHIVRVPHVFHKVVPSKYDSMQYMDFRGRLFRKIEVLYHTDF